MKLRCNATQSNGLQGKGYWYVASLYVDEKGEDNFTLSLNQSRAHEFYGSEAENFQKMQLLLGHITKKFEIER